MHDENLFSTYFKSQSNKNQIPIIASFHILEYIRLKIKALIILYPKIVIIILNNVPFNFYCLRIELNINYLSKK
ncbi:hypothetical protein BpHYR1_011830 [Brachionus plicatilis]|uniref:Uncharacterized protein n=1 Tax=Brachionus plicatilis TaxID=10195 RepID=A0A3M7RW90_BRAPC|nr:hypothetical protein BpHYR1_011830 [Brachionus plicatilis]